MSTELVMEPMSIAPSHRRACLLCESFLLPILSPANSPKLGDFLELMLALLPNRPLDHCRQVLCYIARRNKAAGASFVAIIN